MAITPKERRAQMIKARGKTESTGINPNSPRARLEKQKSQTTKRSSITPKQRRAQMMSARGASESKSKLPERIQKSRAAFNEKARAANEARTGIVSKATKARRAAADVEKGLPRGKPAPSQMEDYKPTSTAKAITKTEKTIAKSPAKTKPGVGAKRAMAGISEFGKAFAKARKEGKKEFPFRGAQYAAITKQEVKKAGASGLGDYLNKLKRKDTKIVKANLNKGGKVTLTGEQKQTAKEKMKARRRAMKGMAKYDVGGKVTLEDKNISPEIQKMAEEFLKRESGAAVTSDELKKLQPRKFERDFDRPRAERLPMKPGMRPKGDNLPMRPGMRRQNRPLSERLKELRGAAMTDAELRRIRREGMKSGGSVMARGCKMGKKKPTKLY